MLNQVCAIGTLSKQKKKKKHCLNKVTTFNVMKSSSATYHKLKTSNAMWLCYLTFTRVYSFPSSKSRGPLLLTVALLSRAGHSLPLSLIPFTGSCEDEMRRHIRAFLQTVKTYIKCVVSLFFLLTTLWGINILILILQLWKLLTIGRYRKKKYGVKEILVLSLNYPQIVWVPLCDLMSAVNWEGWMRWF